MLDPGVEELRRGYDRVFGRLPVDPGVHIDEICAGVPALRLRPKTITSDALLLFVHGGGFVMGNPEGARSAAAALARAAGFTVLIPRYRLAPETRFPGGRDDVLAAYQALLSEGIPPTRIAVLGESAGGALALGAVLRASEPPAALALWSPWLDLTFSGAAVESNRENDRMVTAGVVDACLRSYLDEHTPAAATDLNADFSALPPTLVQVSSSEVLLDDSRRFVQNATRARVAVRFEILDDELHVFQYFPAISPAAVGAVARTAQFLADHTAR